MCKLEDLTEKVVESKPQNCQFNRNCGWGNIGIHGIYKRKPIPYIVCSMDNINGIKRQGAGMEKSLTDSDLWQLQHHVSNI